jgi:nucleotidyltransferase substrate binding protein (TIGR01987 family)
MGSTMFKSSGMISDIRWKQRFDNFDRAFVLLREVYERKLDSLSRLEKEGAIQRFKVAFELAWKTINDYLEESGVVVNPVTPRNVIKEAFTARLLDDADVWVDMMLHRNLLSHTYDIKVFEVVLQALAERYFPAFDRLHEWFLMKRLET